MSSIVHWLELFRVFAGVAPEVLEAFTDKHPELRAPPARAAQGDLWDKFQDDLADKFPKKDDEGET